MLCTLCHTENREGRRFCSKCAAPLAVVCPTCGFTNDPGDDFCGGCAQSLRAGTQMPPKFQSPDVYTPKHLAEKILNSKVALEGERKQVTVLFADLKGSMELLADRDPEEARKILDAVLERMMDAVHRFEGTVNQVMGDGIMALFGAPVAHEDHAVRACYAALRMQESVKEYAKEARHAHGASVQIRVGLNSGDVIVRAVGSDLRMDYTAVGQTTHLAARMEQLADPGTIVVTPATLSLVEERVEVASLGPVVIKGLTDPLEVFEVTGVGVASTRLHAAARRGLTRFVGRDSELEQLWRVQEQAGRGRGQVMALVGEAGVGKSRLVYEFTHSYRTQGWLVLEAASVSYGKATSYLPVIALLKSYFKIQDRDDQREMREKVTGKLLALDRSLEPTLPALLSLLDIPVEDPTWQTALPEQRRRQTLDGVKRLLLREAREQPLVVIFEDLHWIDAETQALLDGLVESLGSARLLLLVNYRPEYQHAWVGKTYYSQLRLDALPPASAADLLDALLGEDPSLASLKQLLVKRGNPFFVEESVRTLVETKALAGGPGRYRLDKPLAAIQIPATVQAMLAARIDRLPPEAKWLLQVASVIGTDVPFVLLREVGEEPEDQLRTLLTQLQAAEFLHETALFPDVEYSFKHALTHEVTYGGLLQEHRRPLHARIVEAIEKVHRDRLDDQVERLAHHAVRGNLREKAVDYLQQAGLKAAGRSALHDARVSFNQALDMVQELPENPSTLEKAFDVRIQLRAVLLQLDELRDVLGHMREAERIAERLNDEGKQARVWAFMSWSYRQKGDLDDALVLGTRALDITKRREDLDFQLHAASGLVELHFYRGDLSRAIELGRQVLAELPSDQVLRSIHGGAAPVSIVTRYNLIYSLIWLGRFSEAAVYEVEMTQLADQTHHAFSVSLAHSAAALLHIVKGDWAHAHSRIERLLALARTADARHRTPTAVALSALVLAQLGRKDEAMNRLREAEGFLDQQVANGLLGNFVSICDFLGRSFPVLGEIEEAQRYGNRAIAGIAARPVVLPRVLWLLADITSHPDRFDAEQAETYYRRSKAAAEAQGQRPV